MTSIYQPKKKLTSSLLFTIPCMIGHILCVILEEYVPVLNYFLFMLSFFAWTLIYSLVVLRGDTKLKTATIAILCSSYNILRSIIGPVLTMVFPYGWIFRAGNVISIIVIGAWLNRQAPRNDRTIPTAYCLGITVASFAASVINTIEGIHYVGGDGILFTKFEFLLLNSCLLIWLAI